MQIKGLNLLEIASTVTSAREEASREASHGGAEVGED